MLAWLLSHSLLYWWMQRCCPLVSKLPCPTRCLQENIITVLIHLKDKTSFAGISCIIIELLDIIQEIKSVSTQWYYWGTYWYIPCTWSLIRSIVLGGYSVRVNWNNKVTEFSCRWKMYCTNLGLHGLNSGMLQNLVRSSNLTVWDKGPVNIYREGGWFK